MKKYAKILVLVLCVCLLMGLMACGNKPAADETQDPTEKTWPIPTVNNDGPNENQCAGDPTIVEETDYPTEPSVQETEEEALIDETTQTESQPEEPLPPVEEETGDIQIPFPED